MAGTVTETVGNVADMLPSNCPAKMLLYGPRKSCKRTLMFQVALKAARDGHGVLFFTHCPFEYMPLMEDGVKPDGGYMERIKFEYSQTTGDIVNCLTQLHKNRNDLPKVIIVHRLDALVSKRTDRWLCSVAKFCGQLSESIQYCSSQLGVGGQLVVSWESRPEDSMILNVFEVFFHNDTWRITTTDERAIYTKKVNSQSFIHNEPFCTESSIVVQFEKHYKSSEYYEWKAVL